MPADASFSQISRSRGDGAASAATAVPPALTRAKASAIKLDEAASIKREGLRAPLEDGKLTAVSSSEAARDGIKLMTASRESLSLKGVDAPAASAEEARDGGDIKLMSPASRAAVSARLSGAEAPAAPAAEARAAGGGMKRVSPASSEALSERLKGARASAAAAEDAVAGGSKLASRKDLQELLNGAQFAAPPAAAEEDVAGGGILLMSTTEREELLKTAQFPAPPSSAGENGGVRRKLQSCSAGSGVTVTSSEFPVLEGCLIETEVFVNFQVEYVTEDGLGIIVAFVPTGYFEV